MPRACRRPATRGIDDGCRIDDAFPDGACDVPPGQYDARKLKDSRNQDSLPDVNGFGSVRRAHRIGHVVCANAPCHVEAERDRQPHEHHPVRNNYVHVGIGLAGSHESEAIADLLGAVRKITDPLDEAIPEDHGHRIERIFQFEQSPGELDLKYVGFVFLLVEFSDHLFNTGGVTSAESRLQGSSSSSMIRAA